MYVAVRQTVLDRILDRINAIRRNNQEPEHIVVSQDEFRELRDDRRVYNYLDRRNLFACDDRPCDAVFKTYEFTKRGGSPDDRDYRIRTYSQDKFMGLPLIVVPSAAYVPA